MDCALLTRFSYVIHLWH